MNNENELIRINFSSGTTRVSGMTSLELKHFIKEFPFTRADALAIFFTSEKSDVGNGTFKHDAKIIYMLYRSKKDKTVKLYTTTDPYTLPDTFYGAAVDDTCHIAGVKMHEIADDDPVVEYANMLRWLHQRMCNGNINYANYVAYVNALRSSLNDIDERTGVIIE